MSGPRRRIHARAWPGRVSRRTWTGIAAGFGFMVLDTVDGKLARCTGQSSKWGNIFDHGVDLIHPPFWWWAWAEGLSDYGRPLDDRVYELMIVGAMMTAVVLNPNVNPVHDSIGSPSSPRRPNAVRSARRASEAR